VFATDLCHRQTCLTFTQNANNLAFRKFGLPHLSSSKKWNSLFSTCSPFGGAYEVMKSSKKTFSEADKDEFIHMALSDHVSFSLIGKTYGLKHDEIKNYMKLFLSPGSYRAWRKRVKLFTQRRQTYK
jgi:uncharacterized protein (TIGR03643 family)